MEWIVEKRINSLQAEQILKVCASGELKFVVWVKSNFEIPLHCMLTPVIDGYIANHDRVHFVAIQRVMPFSKYEWESLEQAVTANDSTQAPL